MTGKAQTYDELCGEFSTHYMEKIFYFCLKKTGKSGEAEDLTQDIALNILTALHKGTVPAHFSAWVWQIARNRYAAWAAAKHRYAESVTGSDIGECEIEDTDTNVEDAAIRRDELARLRRELAFIRGEYRDVLVSYYVQNRSMRSIAEDLSLSLDTVKKRLQRARTILKEGMNMAREFGTRSYNPEEISFSNSCSSFGEKGQPWSILSHTLYKNIFLEAYGNPSTAEALSLELGVALPYMEDELAYLTRETFLRKTGDRFETAFPIISRDAQEKIWAYNQQIAVEVTHLLEKLVDDYSAACSAHGVAYYGTYQTYAEAKWTLLMRAFDCLMDDLRGGYLHEYTKRPDHGNWDIVGFQKADVPQYPYVGQHGSGRGEEYLAQYKFAHGGIGKKTPDYIDQEEVEALQALARGNLSACTSKHLEALSAYGYIRKTETGYEPAILLFAQDEAQHWAVFNDAEKQAVKQTAERLKAILADASLYAQEVTGANLPPVFKNDERMNRFASAHSRMRRDIILEQALADGWLVYDDKTSRAIGAYMYI